ncbi:MAG TPA: PilW family protein [Steroidobacteraceae bacterium]
MSHKIVHNTAVRRPCERGYSMIELSVALVVALFLLQGLFTILQNTRSASANQNQLAQLQDEQRMSMTMLTDVIQQAGYYPGAYTTDAATALPASALFLTAGQSVAGSANATASYGDTVSVRYQGDPSGRVLDCLGSVIPDGTTEEMTFSVNKLNNSPLGLYCSINGAAAVPLIPNVTKMTVTYGVDSNSKGSTNAYLTAAQVTAGTFWNSILSVKVALLFGNPLYGQPGQTKQNLPFNRVVAVLSKTGTNGVTIDGTAVDPVTGQPLTH